MGVDLVLAGHVHRYQRSYPVRGGRPTQKNYNVPDATVHVMAGNGGCGGTDQWESFQPEWEAYRDLSYRPGYGRVDANGTALRWEMRDIHGSLFDTFTITKNLDISTVDTSAV